LNPGWRASNENKSGSGRKRSASPQLESLSAQENGVFESLFAEAEYAAGLPLISGAQQAESLAPSN